MADSFRYILRYFIDPEWEAEARTEELAAFCRRARVEEVMLFFNAEEFFTGHVTMEELRPWRAMAAKVKARLAADGVAMSLNPWTTTAHLARGRRLAPDQNFRLMVGENGVTAGITACPLDGAWQAYLGTLWGLLARELEIGTIWVEDDWRLHNHDPEQGWGGCFCAEHLRRFARLAGRETVTREEVLAALLAPGKPHPWRELWLELSRDTMLEAARALRRQLPESCNLGLMSSLPDVHSIEGRDWPRLQRILAGTGVFLSRPHLPPYTEGRLADAAPTVARHTVARLTPPFAVYPELESGLRCGWYSRSPRLSILQCFQSALFGARGITINHFDMMGNGLAMDDPGFGEALAGAKAQLNALAALRLADDAACGISVLSHPEIAAHLQLAAAGRSLGELAAQSAEWSRVLYMLGISHRLTDQVDEAHDFYAVSDQTLRAFDDAALDALLGKTVLLDAVALDTLIERVGGAALGIGAAEWRDLTLDAYAYERFDWPEEVAGARTSAQMCANRVLKLEPDPAARVLSTLFTARREELYPAFCEWRTPRGGRVIATAYPLNGAGSLFYVAFFNRFRRISMQALVGTAAGGVTADAPLVQVSALRCTEGVAVGAFNLNSSPLAEVTLRYPPEWGTRIRVLDADGAWRETTAAVAGKLEWNREFAPLDGAICLIG